MTNQLTKITDAVVLERTIRGVRAALGTGSSETRFARAEQVIIEAKAALPPPRRFDEVLGARRMLAPRAHFALLIDSTIATGAAAAMKRAAGDFERSVSMVTGIRPRKLPHVELRWLRQRRVTRSKEPEPRPPQSVMRSDYQRLSRSTPMARSHVGSLADYARTAPWQAHGHRQLDAACVYSYRFKKGVWPDTILHAVMRAAHDAEPESRRFGGDRLPDRLGGVKPNELEAAASLQLPWAGAMQSFARTSHSMPLSLSAWYGPRSVSPTPIRRLQHLSPNPIPCACGGACPRCCGHGQTEAGAPLAAEGKALLTPRATSN